MTADNVARCTLLEHRIETGMRDAHTTGVSAATDSSFSQMSEETTLRTHYAIAESPVRDKSAEGTSQSQETRIMFVDLASATFSKGLGMPLRFQSHWKKRSETFWQVCLSFDGNLLALARTFMR